jgi:D-alanyl-D-alanine carboxypeptidase (penicillin-binding protein 5/6)
MRPPEHWHLRRGRATPPWWLFAVAAVAIAVVAVVALRLEGGGPLVDGPEGSVETVTSLLSAEAPNIRGRAAAVIEEPCGALLYGLNADARRPPASLAKMATALVAVERLDLDETLEVRVNSAFLVASTASTVMGLEPGMRLTVRDLLYGLLLPSGNDAAVAIAEAAADNASAFVDLMNAKAAELGLENTHFANPHGLDEAAMYASARDMAVLGSALLAHPELAAMVRTERYQPAWDGPEVWNGNALLDLYPEAIGIKIGYTEKAGQTIVAAAERDGRRLIVSVLGTWDRYADAIALFEWAFAETERAC